MRLMVPDWEEVIFRNFRRIELEDFHNTAGPSLFMSVTVYPGSMILTHLFPVVASSSSQFTSVLYLQMLYLCTNIISTKNCAFALQRQIYPFLNSKMIVFQSVSRVTTVKNALSFMHLAI